MKRKQILINLSTQPRPDNSWLLKSLLLAAILIIVLGGGMGFFYNQALNSFRYQEAIYNELHSNKNEYVKMQQAIEKQEAVERAYNTKVRHVTEKTKESYRLSTAFSIIEHAVTPNTQIINLKINSNKVILTGLADDYTEVAQVLAALRSSTLLTNTGLISNQNVMESGKVLFEIETVWEAASRCN